MMVVHKTKKVRKQRAGRTYGWGSPKKNRGAGSRGGRGRAGTGKKGQQAMSSIHAGLTSPSGKKGFVRPTKTIRREETINLGGIEQRLVEWLKTRVAVKKSGGVEIDMSKTRYTKVLGAGKPAGKLVIKAARFSKSAEEKLKKTGGRAIKLE